MSLSYPSVVKFYRLLNLFCRVLQKAETNKHSDKKDYEDYEDFLILYITEQEKADFKVNKNILLPHILKYMA